MPRVSHIDPATFKTDAPKMTLAQLAKKYGLQESSARNKCRALGVSFYTERKPTKQDTDKENDVTYLTLEQALAEQKQARKSA